MKEDKSLIIYFSYTGNTAQIAHMIQEQLKCDIFELSPLVSYSKDYQQVVDETNVNHYKKREIKTMPNITEYNKIFLLTPTWWYKMAPIIYTFLVENDFSNKEVIPIMTSAGWSGTVIEDMSKYARDNGATVSKSLEITFDSNGGHTLKTSVDYINNWIQKCIS